MPFARWLVGRMKERRLDNNQLAQKLGVSTGAISEYRRALRRPRRPFQDQIAHFFGVDPEVVYRLLEPPLSGDATDSPVAPTVDATTDTLIDDIDTAIALLARVKARLGAAGPESDRMLERGNRQTDGPAS